MKFERFERDNVKKILKEYEKELKNAYKNVFEGPPWYETWNPKDLDKVIKETILEKSSVKGILAFIDDYLIGFCWGYKIIENGKPTYSPTVDFNSVVEILEEEGYTPENSFYFAEYGIIPEKQNQGYGYVLLGEFTNYLKENGDKYLFYRTINPVVIHLSDKLNKERKIKDFKKDLFNDPKYPERKWQLIIL